MKFIISSSMKKRILTGITTTGIPHIGNFFGAIKPAIELSASNDAESFLFLADLHAIIKQNNHSAIEDSVKNVALAWLSAGLNPDNTYFYRQSDIPEISELAWILGCVTAKGLINRSHAYKAAVDQNKANNLDDATKLESEKNLYEQVQNYGMVMSSALLLGLSKRIIDSAKLYTCDREQFGKPIGSFQAVKHMLADVAIEIEFTNALVYRAASSIQKNCSNATLHAAQAKFQSIKACEIASKNGLQAHGAMGYTWEMDLHIFVRKGWSYKGIWGSRPFVENLVFNNLKKDLPKLGATYTFMDNND